MKYIYPEEKLTGTDPGVYPDMSAEDYAKGPGISSGGIQRCLKTPLHFIDKYVHPEWYEKDTKATNFGGAFHTHVLEPERLAADVVQLPDVNKRTKDGRAELSKFLEDNKGKRIISAAEQEKIDNMMVSISENRTFMSAVRGGKAEMKGFWIDEATGLLCKYAVDMFKQVALNGMNTGVITDLKTTTDASYSGFSKHIANYGYDIQACHYINGVKATHPKLDTVRYLFAAVESNPPYACAVYRLEEQDIIYAQRKINLALRTLKDCIELQTWPSYPPEISVITQPNWAKPRDK